MPEGFSAGCRLRGLRDKGQRQLCVSLTRIKMNKWQQLDECSTEHPVFYEDEVDIHLNPKIGADWKMRGQQKRVVTPGQNEKYYLVGSLHSGTGNVSYVGGNSKSSALFISLLKRLKATTVGRKPSRRTWTTTLSTKSGKTAQTEGEPEVQGGHLSVLVAT